ncbi:hypothetical protein HY989_04825 [Candidatus Micrarchaeota archaeon]|nr:hypothetical protein [Candidatus Micrarchaeota archaeon]
MGFKELLKPSKEHIFFFLLFALAANFPYFGSYHTDTLGISCKTNNTADCQTSGERTIRLNPLFWFPYTIVGNSDVLTKNPLGIEEEISIPILKINAFSIQFFLALLYWYLASGLMIYGISRKEDSDSK